MKNRILILFALIVAAAAAGGQSLPYTTVLLETNPLASRGGIIRSWTPTKAVIYHEQFVSAANRTGIFSIMGAGSTTMQSVKFPNGFYAHDFQILGDTLYFGGTIANGNDGVLGFFSLTDLENGTLNSVTVYSGVQEIRQVKKLAAYRINNGTGVGVAAVGWGMVSGPVTDFGVSFAIQLRLLPNNPICRYMEVESLRFSSGSEYLDEVVVTDNYVAFVGDYQSSDLCIRRGDRNDFLSDLEFGTRRRFILPPYGPTNRFVATAMTGDNIAVARSGDDGTTARTAVFMVKLSSWTMYESQQIPGGGKDCCVDLEYMKYDNTLLLLMETYNSAVTQQTNKLIYLTPGQPLPAIVPVFYPSNGTQMGCVSVHDQCYILAGSPSRWMLHRKSVLSPTSQCLIVDDVSAKQFNVCAFDKYNYSDTPIPLTVHQMSVNPTIESYQATCIHQ